MNVPQADPAGIRPRDRLEDRHPDNPRLLARLIAEGRLGRDLAVTCRGKRDGAGAQASAAISAMLLARFAGCRYFHSPFVSLDHAEGPHREWAERWERFLNLGDGETLVPDDAELVPLPDVLEAPEAYAGRPVVAFQRAFGLPGEAVPIREALREELRAKYWRNDKTAIPSHRGPAAGLTVAIHLRRGDVNAERNAHRFVQDQVVLRQIRRLRRALVPFGRKLTLNLYSEGRAEDFRAFAKAGCQLHISEDAFESFHNMVTADILLSAHSAFSYIAALLSRGIVLAHRGRPPALQDWLGRPLNGRIPVERLQQALLARSGWLDRQTCRARLWWRRRRAA